VPADRKRVTEIQQQALAEPWPALLATALEGPPPLYVADDGRPVGYCIVVPGGEQVLYVPELAVHPARQGEGLGSALLEALACEFDSHSELRLTMRAVDSGAREFYDAHGFEQVERVADHFDSGDGIVLRKRLTES
jgi:ribosomal protein S18 acetylase RimI-like enzyme